VSDNRTRILEVALRLFSARGYDGIGVQEIVQECGVTKPTLYHYFKSKQGLLQAILEEHFEPFLDGLEKAAAYQGDLPLTLQKITRHYFESVKRNPAFYRLTLALHAAPPESEVASGFRPMSERQFSILAAMFTAAVEQHGNLRDKSRQLAATFVGMVNTWMSISLNGQIELTEELIYKTLQQYMYGIYS